MFRVIKKPNKFFLITLFCVIVVLIAFFINYAIDLSYRFKEIDIGGDRTVRIMPDSTAFHWYISEYNAIDKQMYPVSLTGPMIEPTDKLMQGYGKYHMQMQYNLGNFIAYCHNNTSYSSVIENLCQYGNQEKEFPESLNYESLTTKLTGQANYLVSFSNTITTLWNTMSQIAGPEFETMQDEFIAKKYLIPAINVMRLNNSEYKELFNIEGSYLLSISDIDNLDGDEFMTVLLSSVYSEFYTADISSKAANEINIGRGNLIPFLYNVDITGTSGRDIGATD